MNSMRHDKTALKTASLNVALQTMQSVYPDSGASSAKTSIAENPDLSTVVSETKQSVRRHWLVLCCAARFIMLQRKVTRKRVVHAKLSPTFPEIKSEGTNEEINQGR